MTDRELMQQALEALEKMKSHSYLRLDYAEEAINALSDRLAQPEQEPACWYDKHGMVTHDPSEGITPLYKSPRPWVGLTEEEIKECFKITPDLFLPLHIYSRIEAKLKKKNGG